MFLLFEYKRAHLLKDVPFYLKGGVVYCSYMRISGKINPEWALRLGLGLTFLYSGSSLFANPEQWLGFVPGWFARAVEALIQVGFYLRLQGIAEITIGFLLIAWFFGKWGLRIGAFFASVELALIIIFTGLDAITFRDIGLLGAAISLLMTSFSLGPAQASQTNEEFPKT